MIRHYSRYPNHVLPNIDESLSRSFLLERGLRDIIWRQPGQEELYDLVFDPAERENLAAQPEYQDILRELSDALDHWMEETDDPLLKGEIPRSLSAQVCRFDGFDADSDFEEGSYDNA